MVRTDCRLWCHRGPVKVRCFRYVGNPFIGSLLGRTCPLVSRLFTSGKSRLTAPFGRKTSRRTVLDVFFTRRQNLMVCCRNIVPGCLPNTARMFGDRRRISLAFRRRCLTFAVLMLIVRKLGFMIHLGRPFLSLNGQIASRIISVRSRLWWLIGKFGGRMVIRLLFSRMLLFLAW